MKKTKKQRSSLQGKDAGQQADAVIAAIKRIPGIKIVTLLSSHSLNPHMTIDVSAEGDFGYHMDHFALFRAKLMSAMLDGSVVVRQFLNVTFQCDGRELPRKIVYGVAFHDSCVIPLMPDSMKVCHETCAETGQPLEPEPGVSYGDFGEFLNAS